MKNKAFIPMDGNTIPLTGLMTRKEVAKHFKINLSTVHNWCKKGYLQPYGIGGRVYFKKSQIEDGIIELKTKK